MFLKIILQKTLCYSELTYEEIKHRLSGRFLLTCIENWFLKTSMNKLHQLDQPIEPFFPYVNDYFIWDGIANEVDFEKYIVEKRGPGKLVYQGDMGDYFAVLYHEIPPDHSNLIHNMPQTMKELLSSLNNIDTVKTWAQFIFKIVSDVKRYNCYFQQSINKLLQCKVLIKLLIPKSRTADESPESYDLRVFITESPLKNILADYGFEIQGSKVIDDREKCNYGCNIRIQPFNVLLQNSRLQNRRLNAIDKETGNEKITLIGAGAIGSHILNNCLREGYGIWTVIDDDFFWPHNIAHHILTSQSVGCTKVDALQKLSHQIQCDFDITALPEDFFSGSDAVHNALESADIIIDASTSIAVERSLALDSKSNARHISCFLNPSGTATVMLLGSVDQSARLDLLEMQYYRELLSDMKYSEHMVNPESIVYSGTCRSITSRISQDNISLGASLCSKALKLHLKDERGKIIIWTHDNDFVNTDIFDADDWITYKYEKWEVEISFSLLKEIRSDRDQNMPNETGGVLLGCFDLYRKRVYIVDQIRAPEDSASSPISFIRGCKNLPEELDFVDRTTAKNLTYIGEWHSHPSNNTQMSADDGKLHHAIVEYNRENCLPGCMMVVGAKDYSIYIGE